MNASNAPITNLLAMLRRRVMRWEERLPVGRRWLAAARRLAEVALRRAGATVPAVTDDHVARWRWRADADWVDSYKASSDRPYRHHLVDVIARFGPLSSALELGCHVGPNLRLLARRFPAARITGVDVNPHAIREGARWLADLPNVTVAEGDLRSTLGALDESSVDCIFSCFALAYVDPTEIEETLRLALRAARRALVLLEPQRVGTDMPAQESGWNHDYRTIIERLGCAHATVELLAPHLRYGGLDALLVAAKTPPGL